GFLQLPWGTALPWTAFRHAFSRRIIHQFLPTVRKWCQYNFETFWMYQIRHYYFLRPHLELRECHNQDVLRFPIDQQYFFVASLVQYSFSRSIAFRRFQNYIWL